MAAASVVPTPQLAAPATGLVGLLNSVVTKLLNPFLAPSPSAPDPFTPAVWAVLGWVRRNLFNQSTTISYNPTTTVQTGQTVTGNLGASDPESDALTYKVTQGPQQGTLTIDQATGNYTYTPDDINYDAAQTDSFTVSVTDGKFNLLSLFSPHGAKASVDVTVLNPTIERVILNLPDGITNPKSPRFSADGKSVVFVGTPTAGGRTEIYQINVDNTGLKCLTCGVAPEITANMGFTVPFTDGSGRYLVQAGGKNNILETEGPAGPQLIPILTPPGPAVVLDPLRFPQIAPDGQHIAFSQYGLGPNNYVAIYTAVGTLRRTATAYEIDDARVIYPVGEIKEFTPDGKGVVLLGGQYEAGNVDNIVVDLGTGDVTRVTANLDYDEDMNTSPNGQWIAVGSLRGDDALTPMTRIVRPNLLPAYIVGPVYAAYRTPVNVTNQVWAVAEEDELKGENGIPLFVDGDGYASRSSITWNANGDAVAIYEVSKTDPTDSRIVIANLKYTTSVGSAPADTSTPDPTWAPKLSGYVPGPPPLPAVGSYAGAGGGTAVISEAPDPTDATRTIRTVTYTDYVNELGMILNGSESTNTNGSQLSIHYTADITVTGTHTGYLRADATVLNRQTLTGYITSDLDGDVQSILDTADITQAQQGV